MATPRLFLTTIPSILPSLRAPLLRHPPPPTRPAPFRSLHSSRPIFARYERFESSQGSSGPSTGGAPGGGSSGGAGGGAGRGDGGPVFGGADVVGYLKRRLGGQRAVWVYGIGIGGGAIYYVVHLERVSETGRLRFIDVDQAQERELGLQTQLQTLQEYSRSVLPNDHPTTRRVRKVAQRIIEASGLGRMKSGGEMGAVEGKVPSFGGGGEEMNMDMGEVFFGGSKGADLGIDKETEWEVYVIDDKKTKNAFVLPGGKIFVFTGILPVSANDDGLATVLGHEVAHQVARHPAERMSYMKVLFAMSFLLESLGLDVGITRVLVTFLLQLPNSRKSESEADFIGLRLMSRACFDPSESTKMWVRMSESESASGMGNIDFLSTHPANSKRIKQLEKWLPEAQQIRAGSSCASTGSQFGGFLDTLSNSKW